MIAAVLAAAIAFTAKPADAAAPVVPAAAPVTPVAPVAADAKPAAAGPLITSVPAAPAEGPDVELHLPHAEIAKLGLEVENLQARLDIDTSVAGLVRISAGVVATVQKLKMQLEGVQAETHLVVRLNRVADVMERALGAIDTHPEIAGAPAPAPAASAAPPTAAPAPAPTAAAPSTPPRAATTTAAATTLPLQSPAISVDADVTPRDAPLPASQE